MAGRLRRPCPIWASQSRSQDEGPLEAGRGRESLGLWECGPLAPVWGMGRESRTRDPGGPWPASLIDEEMGAEEAPWPYKFPRSLP